MNENDALSGRIIEIADEIVALVDAATVEFPDTSEADLARLRNVLIATVLETLDDCVHAHYERLP